jgi:flagellum-specific ATP synthase
MKALAKQITDIDGVEIYGGVVAVRGLMVEVAGPIYAMSVGARLTIETGPGSDIPCEVVGFTQGHALAMPFASLDGVRRGFRALVSTSAGAVRPSERWLGRVLNAMGEPIDGLGPLPAGPAPYPFRASPPPAHTRQRVGEPLDLGVRALNTFITVCRGQRMGIFSGSGVGKSVLLSMRARNVNADVSVIGLVGERGREVQEFLQDDLGPEGLARSVVVVSTSDEPALLRRQAAYLTLAIAEYFRDVHKDVLVLMDSVTRFAMAQREIGLSAGEPPTAKGYTPTVVTELPRLLERAIAEHGRYPAINVLKSISRTMPRAADPAYLPAITRAKQVMATYSDMEELIRLGAYRPGSSADVDEAIGLHKPLEDFLRQGKEESTSMAEGYQRLETILQGAETKN